ncbi:MAG TPA: DUF2294 domain-containing protein [Kiritimatiellia bacterium]|nr:DUF2294 domain-containing protein [Kiritimatiellia bacterium]
MNNRRGELETKITEAMIKFEREFMGRGPTEARTYLLEDMVLIRMKGIITRAEAHLASADPTGRGRDLVKQSRTELLEKAKPMLKTLIEKELKINVISMHTDISVKASERFILFTLERKFSDQA